jgi:hypothetical protein
MKNGTELSVPLHLTSIIVYNQKSGFSGIAVAPNIINLVVRGK